MWLWGSWFVDVEQQRQILGGATAFDVIQLTSARAEWSDDPGAVALAVWAAAEALNQYNGVLVND